MYQKLTSFSILMFLPILLLAHGNHGNGVLAGFTHPILGLDHAIAILGTGCLGFLLNPSKWYLQLLAFIFAMILGGLLGIDNEATFLIEKTIALSVLAIGAVIAFDIKINLTLSIILLSIVGAFHGYAHGAEMDETNTALKYISGYSLGTFLVGTAGMFLAKTIASLDGKEKYISILGGCICGAGVVMLLG